MQIDVWSDFSCPFCYIGKKHLEKAIGNRGDVVINFHSFELDPNAELQSSESIYEVIAKKYGISLGQSITGMIPINEMAKAVGAAFNFDKIQVTNSFSAHKLAHFAKEKNLCNEFVDAVMTSYFCKGGLISDEETLVQLAESVGINGDEARHAIRSQDYDAKVRQDEQKAQELEIHAVPYFIIDNRYDVAGAQPTEVFEKILSEIAQRDTSATK